MTQGVIVGVSGVHMCEACVTGCCKARGTKPQIVFTNVWCALSTLRFRLVSPHAVSCDGITPLCLHHNFVLANAMAAFALQVQQGQPGS